MKALRMSATVLVVVPLLAINTRGCARAVTRKPPPVRVRPISPPHLPRTAPTFQRSAQRVPARPMLIPSDHPFPKPPVDAGDFERRAPQGARAADEAEKATFGDHIQNAAQDVATDAGSRALDRLVSGSAAPSMPGRTMADEVARRDQDLRADLREGDRLMALNERDRAAAHYRSGMSKAIARHGPGSPPAIVFQTRLVMVMFGPVRPAERPRERMAP